MDTKTLKAMAGRLQELANEAELFDKTVDVCREARITAGLAGMDKVTELFSGWPEFSGEEIGNETN